MPEDTCPIWGVSCIVHPHNLHTDAYLVEGSFRAGGKYEIASSERYITREDLNPDELARLTSFLVKQRMLGVEVPRITRAEVLRAKERDPLPVHERAERLLRLFVNQSPSISAVLEITPLNLRTDGILKPGEVRNKLKVTHSALAWSESTTNEELSFLTNYLEMQGWITKNKRISDGIGPYIPFYGNAHHFCRVEVPGYSHVEETRTNPDSSQCFVAMWFDDSMNDVYERGFRAAIEAAGYTPLRIDQKPDLIGKIDDAIIAEIRRSRFIVADFTHGQSGARGGVYYEAGFARGLGLDVIFTCRKDMMDNVHFDTDHFNHILWEWENPEDLREQLTDTIVAAIGQGPNRSG